MIIFFYFYNNNLVSKNILLKLNLLKYEIEYCEIEYNELSNIMSHHPWNISEQKIMIYQKKIIGKIFDNTKIDIVIIYFKQS